LSGHYAILLTAGFSTRMGYCKAKLPWKDGQTLLSYQATNFLRAGIIPIIVLGTHNGYCRLDCPRGSRVIYNLDANRGKVSSILLGLQAMPAFFKTVTISAVDQPRSVELYDRLLQVYLADRPPIVAPMYQARIGHPLLFCRAMLPHLLKITEANQGLRAIVGEFYGSIRFIDWNSAEVINDLNSPETYLALRKNIVNSV